MRKLMCPHCKLPLIYKADGLFCSECSRWFKIEKGIYEFIDEKKPSEDLFDKKILEVISEGGFEGALRKFPSDMKYIYNDSRVNWLYHCYDPNNKESCLDLGSGWGTLAFPLCRWYDEVWSVEKVSERAGFQALRRKKENGNMSIINGNLLDLPFSNDSFDLIVLNGVLEWVPLADPNPNPTKAQLNLLLKTKSLLKNDGCLYVGIENRFGFLYFLGAKDHDGLPFTSVLPRKVSNFVSKTLSGREYRTYTYSAIGYRNLLRKAGFDHVEIFWVMPLYHFPEYSSKLEDVESFKFYLKVVSYREKRLLRKLLLKTCLSLPNFIFRWVLQLFCPSFLIFAWKNSKSTLESTLLDATHSESFLRCNAASSRRVIYFMLNNGRDKAKIAFSDLSAMSTYVKGIKKDP